MPDNQDDNLFDNTFWIAGAVGLVGGVAIGATLIAPVAVPAIAGAIGISAVGYASTAIGAGVIATSSLTAGALLGFGAKLFELCCDVDRSIKGRNDNNSVAESKKDDTTSGNNNKRRSGKQSEEMGPEKQEKLIKEALKEGSRLRAEAPASNDGSRRTDSSRGGPIKVEKEGDGDSERKILRSSIKDERIKSELFRARGEARGLAGSSARPRAIEPKNELVSRALREGGYESSSGAESLSGAGSLSGDGDRREAWDGGLGGAGRGARSRALREGGYESSSGAESSDGARSESGDRREALGGGGVEARLGTGDEARGRALGGGGGFGRAGGSADLVFVTRKTRDRDGTWSGGGAWFRDEAQGGSLSGTGSLSGAGRWSGGGARRGAGDWGGSEAAAPASGARRGAWSEGGAVGGVFGGDEGGVGGEAEGGDLGGAGGRSWGGSGSSSGAGGWDGGWGGGGYESSSGAGRWSGGGARRGAGDWGGSEAAAPASGARRGAWVGDGAGRWSGDGARLGAWIEFSESENESLSGAGRGARRGAEEVYAGSNSNNIEIARDRLKSVMGNTALQEEIEINERQKKVESGIAAGVSEAEVARARNEENRKLIISQMEEIRGAINMSDADRRGTEAVIVRDASIVSNTRLIFEGNRRRGVGRGT